MIPLILAGLMALASLGIVGTFLWHFRLRYRLAGLRYRAAQVVIVFLLLCTGMAFLAGVLLGYYYYRPQPDNIAMDLFEGIHYERVARRAPFPLVYHVVRIDLNTPELSFLVTPPDFEGEYEMRAQTTTQFLKKHQLQLAINSNFFYPVHVNSPWDYYPASGEPVAVLGEAASSGNQYSARSTHYVPVSISDKNRIIFGEVKDGYNILAGKHIALSGNTEIPIPNPQRYPRTALALDEESHTLILLVVDGRQPNYSEGLSMHELGALLLSLGADQAINLDGGGSSTLVMQRPNGQAKVLNTPIHTRIPGRERAVANHLGLYAAPLRDVSGVASLPR